MTLRIRPTRVEGRLRAPPSKSHTHRAYILAALSGNGSIQNPLESQDTQATLGCLESLGMLVGRFPTETRVGGTFRAPRVALRCGNSGTTLRLMTAVASLVPHPVTLDAEAGLRSRPMGPLLAALEQLGATTQSVQGVAPVTVKGPLRGGEAGLPANVSSQFVSALLLACPVAPEDSHIRLEGPIVSRPYIDLTLSQLCHHGVVVGESDDAFQIRGGQRVRQRPFSVPGDYSSAAFLLAAAAITRGRLTLENLLPEDPQGDRAILDFLRRFGARVSQDAASVTVEGSDLVAQDVDVGQVPDLFPILCVLAACARGTSTLRGAPHLRAKESDRIRAMAVNLGRAGLEAKELPDGLRITGGIPKGITIQSFNDHRVAMALTVLALAARGASELPDEAVVAKSYPNFHNDLLTVAPEVARK